MFQAVVELIPGAGGGSLATLGERRGGDREPVDIKASVRARGSSLRLRTDVVDISTQGCRIVASDYAVGDDVLITLAHLAPVPGRVRWVRDGAAGVQFGTRLHPSVVSHLASL